MTMPRLSKLLPLSTVADVIDVLGGPTAVGRLTGNPASGVCNWRRERPHFPPKYYPTIQAALKDKGYYAHLHLFAFHGVRRRAA
jgi:hypothetical protein